MGGTFAADISKFCQKADANAKQVVRKIAFEAFKRVVMKTPVDTGRARANWSVCVGNPVTGVTGNGTDKDGSGTLQKALQGVTEWDCNGSIFLVNNLPYIGPLEYGHSQQAPNGMVRLTAEEMTTWAAQAAAK